MWLCSSCSHDVPDHSCISVSQLLLPSFNEDNRRSASQCSSRNSGVTARTSEVREENVMCLLESNLGYMMNYRKRMNNYYHRHPCYYRHSCYHRHSCYRHPCYHRHPCWTITSGGTQKCLKSRVFVKVSERNKLLIPQTEVGKFAGGNFAASKFAAAIQ